MWLWQSILGTISPSGLTETDRSCLDSISRPLIYSNVTTVRYTLLTKILVWTQKCTLYSGAPYIWTKFGNLPTQKCELWTELQPKQTPNTDKVSWVTIQDVIKVSVLSLSVVTRWGSDPDLHGRYSANGLSIETRWGIVLYFCTHHPSSRELSSANGPLNPTVWLIKLLHPIGSCSSQGEEPNISYQDKNRTFGTLR